MGRVFTVIELEAGAVPQAEHFQPAARNLLELLRSDPAEAVTDEVHLALSALDGALVFGSTTKGDANMRSDLDVFIAYNNDAAEAGAVLQGFRQIFDQIHEDWAVPVESTKFRTAHLRAGRHSIDPMLMLHLDTVIEEDWAVGQNPVSLTRAWDTDLLTVFNNYAQSKINKFGHVLSDPPYELDTHTLQRAYELPSALGRKTLALFTQLGIVEADDFQNSSKYKVTNRLNEFCPDNITEPMNELIIGNAEYDELLEAALVGNINLDDYENFLYSFYIPALTAAASFSDRLTDYVLARATG